MTEDYCPHLNLIKIKNSTEMGVAARGGRPGEVRTPTVKYYRCNMV